MSDLPSSPTPSSSDSSPPPASPSLMQRRRPGASVTLREGATSSDFARAADMMDPASKSLADALRITYRLLQVAMVVIFGIYFLSGFQSIKETQRGVRLRFGKVEAQDLSPGFRFAFPQPIGDIIRVETGDQTAELKNEFFPSLSDTEEKELQGEKGIQALAGGSATLDPDRDGQLLTGDSNIVHARWTVTYRRTEPYKSVENIAEDAEDPSKPVEREMVIAAVRRGIVQAASISTIDEVLKKQADVGRPAAGEHATRSIERLAKQIAQQELDKLDIGIQIQELLMKSPMPPRSLIQTFNQVQAAQSKANASLQDAESYRKQTLATAAGEAADLILGRIDLYEKELALKENKDAEQTIDQIDDLMQHKAITIDGRTYNPRIYGKVADMLADAEQYRTNVVTGAQTDASMFHAKRQAYLSNPKVMLASEWSNAFKSFITHPGVQVMQVFDGLSLLELQINRDPDLLRKQKEDSLRAFAEQERKKRYEERDRMQYEEQMNGTGRSEAQ